MTDLITTDLVRLGADWGADKQDVIRALAAVVEDAGRATDKDQLVADAFARESTSATGLPGGIAIPHCRTAGVETPTLAFARLDPPVDFGAKDGPADLAFLIAAPAGGDADHLTILTKLARALVKPAFTDALRTAETPQDVVDLVSHELGEPAPAKTAAAAPAAAPAAGAAPASGAAAPAAAAGGKPSLVAVTACPTGIAHTYMAAEALEAAAERAGVQLQVETQGSAGSTPLAPDTIAAAGAVIFAVDVGVRDRGRFAGKPMVSSGVKRPIDDADAMIQEALKYAADPAGSPRVEGDASAAGGGGGAADESWGGRIRRVLMTGVSYMIPFVAAGGLLIALGFLFGGYEIVTDGQNIAVTNTLFNLPDVDALGLDHALAGSPFFAYLGALFFTLGGAAFGFLVPALAGYIAYAIADRPGIAPGFVMGAIAGVINSGFLGGIIGGVLAGLAAHWIASWKVPVWARGLMPVLVIPLLATMISGFVMLVILGKPLASLMSNLTDGLNSLQGGSAIILGIILGLMMAFDMGGPLNKTAYAFATAGLGAAATATDAPELKVMAAVMLSGMVPPLALALATVVRPGLFTVPERENGKAAWLMGASFITEGAIPFAAADPLRVIPSIMAGSAVTGAISMGMGVELRAPHGGIFVLFAVDGVGGFIIALVAGTLVASALVIALKTMGRKDADIATV
ncbi:PTS system D-fructose-specific IIA component (F1P-forming), Frc family /PTS system D-fructose-specific IIB component (F1P-forming), Frc family /PTS system D-fructose-specific IIC component (F1P-forming), Frc family [Nocardioides exalbidus]|uniref:PTS system D-fructose-specific IIA component (F1P-forming), Frc family /PTS system D-fructose-specific IIB component (F1P-forming), Frc family /PTS system D-fructose-specific IIC component (F1P-for... n=1 Tax=Nocardioides exalbidus TaxID=402596 RepID=A0A1H5AA45_9ACTN|nr:fructose-specific PTS transporter subunit EIIC [Nocardioides exalbidus]SED38631.1 PTS system D-fructose-specific IIA component (F1P-forming), Frc family /PTS system D-fructose-specific IIB component (F1P-forming), Frc family /PTS system D-fructose-specific IIC component (F1P-forming), Frc family [Nocardioides exalbidus]